MMVLPMDKLTVTNHQTHMQLKNKTLGLTALAILASAGQAFSAVVFNGGTTGTFSGATGGDPTAYEYSNGDPVSTFKWGKVNPQNPDSAKSVLTFTGVDPFGPVDCGEEFDIGLIDYFNGTVLQGTSATGVELGIDINFTTPSGLVSLNYALTLYSSPDKNVPGGVADEVTLPDLESQTFILDGNTYRLTLSFEGNQTFFVEEGATDRARLVGVISCVPESGSSLALLGGGMLLVSGLRRKLKAVK